MRTKEDFINTPMGDALFELNEELKRQDYPKITLNVIGGFAMMVHGYRPADSVTDIDYVGATLSEKIVKISEKIGLRNGLGSDWINNDVMLTGSSLEDFETSTGELNFTEAMDLECITVNVIDADDLLRLKIIALDTALSAVELGGDFSRMKDIPDTILLLDGLNTDIETAIEKNKDYLINPHIPRVIDLYKENGADAVYDFLNDLADQNIKELDAESPKTNEERGSMIETMLSIAFARAAKEPDY